jgi:hypothetical protein
MHLVEIMPTVILEHSVRFPTPSVDMLTYCKVARFFVVSNSKLKNLQYSTM